MKGSLPDTPGGVGKGVLNRGCLGWEKIEGPGVVLTPD